MRAGRQSAALVWGKCFIRSSQLAARLSHFAFRGSQTLPEGRKELRHAAGRNAAGEAMNSGLGAAS